MIQITKTQARHFLLHKQLLLPPYKLDGKESVEKVFNTLRLIQYDPLKPCGRNTDLVLQARIADYHPDDYYQWLYMEKKGIECYDKELCILPIEDFPLTALRRDRAISHSRIKLFLKKYERRLEEILQRIEQEGPLSSSDITDTIRVSSGWSDDAKFGRMALEIMWKVGRLVIVKRQNGKKYYDLPQKMYQNLEFGSKKIVEEHLSRRLNSVGMLPQSGSGGGWQGIGSAKELRTLIKEMIRAKKMVSITVKDSKKQYVMNAIDAEKIHGVSPSLNEKKVVFIAPLDNLIWDRDMISDLFNFEYRWEVYTPLVKRKYGYYVLPILYGDTFIGRVEPVLTRDNNLEIKNFWKEKQVIWNNEINMAFSKGLSQFKDYLRADKIINVPKL